MSVQFTAGAGRAERTYASLRGLFFLDYIKVFVQGGQNKGSFSSVTRSGNSFSGLLAATQHFMHFVAKIDTFCCLFRPNVSR